MARQRKPAAATAAQETEAGADDRREEATREGDEPPFTTRPSDDEAEQRAPRTRGPGRTEREEEEEPEPESGRRDAAPEREERRAETETAPPPKPAAKTDRFAESRAKLDEYVRQQSEKVKIEAEEALDPHFRSHSQAFLLATKRAALAADRARSMKDALDKMTADVDWEIRRSGEKMTDDATKKAIARDPRIVAAKEAVAFSEYQADVYKGVVKAWEHKRDMLVQLGSNYRAELGHDPSLRGDRRPPVDRQREVDDTPSPRRTQSGRAPQSYELDDTPPPRRAQTTQQRPASRDDDYEDKRRATRSSDDDFDDTPPRARGSDMRTRDEDDDAPPPPPRRSSGGSGGGRSRYDDEFQEMD